MNRDDFAADVSQYDAEFFDVVDEGARKAASKLLKILGRGFSPTSVIDVGCGSGEWIQAAEKVFGARIFGIDGAWNDRLPEHGFPFAYVDLEERLDINERFDLAICLEVAEHLSSNGVTNLIDSITGLTDVVLFSAAVPHQPGTNHINCRWQSEWIAEFQQRGWFTHDIFRPELWTDSDVPWWYRQNVFLMVRQMSDSFHSTSELLPADVVHPELFDYQELRLRQAEERLLKEEARAANAEALIARPPNLAFVARMAARLLRCQTNRILKRAETNALN